MRGSMIGGAIGGHPLFRALQRALQDVQDARNGLAAIDARADALSAAARAVLPRRFHSSVLRLAGRDSPRSGKC